ncbi:MAG: pyruvate dehydrogenase (acetyl-transferring) component subunit alpha [Subtercola sp.]|nr:pyruvate dehydrogenase (acetyl-transferring) component subunit alpha [Subtercola sp.]
MVEAHLIYAESDEEVAEAAVQPSTFEQLIDHNGERGRGSALEGWVSDITDTGLIAFYEDMVVVRRIDTEATALQRQGELGLWPPLLGQEAAQVGSARALAAHDFIFSSYRENAVAYCRGIAVTDVLKPWRGVSGSGWNPFEYRMATPQIIIGAQTLHATGYALGMQLKGSDSVAITYFGDGATSEGDVNEALVFAATYQAPVVFFCQNNHWAISEPVALQSRANIVDRALGFGIPGIRVDGNDVLAVLAATRLALHRARTGGGPTFIEAVTYRMGAHTTADDPTLYRDQAELDAWSHRDPIVRLSNYLRNSGVLTDSGQNAVDERAAAVAAELRAGCIALKDPDPLSIFDHIYAEPNSKIVHQRARYERYLDMFTDAEPSGGQR